MTAVFTRQPAHPVPGDWAKRAACIGATADFFPGPNDDADRIAIDLGLHPLNIWPDDWPLHYDEDAA